jgi:ribosomal protein S18 acetylase RimI-like enzyme
MRLWNDGSFMKYVSLPDGLGIDFDPQNISAIALYLRLGFTDKNLPAKLEKEGRYMELSKSEETI